MDLKTLETTSNIFQLKFNFVIIEEYINFFMNLYCLNTYKNSINKFYETITTWINT